MSNDLEQRNPPFKRGYSPRLRRTSERREERERQKPRRRRSSTRSESGSRSLRRGRGRRKRSRRQSFSTSSSEYCSFSTSSSSSYFSSRTSSSSSVSSLVSSVSSHAFCDPSTEKTPREKGESFRNSSSAAPFPNERRKERHAKSTEKGRREKKKRKWQNDNKRSRGDSRRKDSRSHGRRWQHSSSSSEDSSSSSSSSDASSSFRHPSEDWVCQLCSNINSLHRDACFRCGVLFRWSHRQHSCMLQAVEVPHEWDAKAIVQALRQAVEGTSPASGHGSAEEEEECLEVVGGAWEEEIRCISSDARVASNAKDNQGGNASRAEHRHRMSRQWNAREDTIEAIAKNRTPSSATDASTVSSFVFFFSSPPNALKALLRCRCQLTLVASQRNSPLEKATLPRLEEGVTSLPHASSSPSSFASSCMKRTTDVPPPSISQTVSLCFASSSLLRMAVRRRYPLLSSTTSVAGRLPHPLPTASIASITRTTGKATPTPIAVPATRDGGEVPSPSPPSLPAALDPSIWSAPQSFCSVEAEEAYVLLLEAHWDQLSAAQKAFYDRTIPLVLMRKRSVASSLPSASLAETVPPSLSASSPSFAAAIEGESDTTHPCTRTPCHSSSTALPSPTISTVGPPQRTSSATGLSPTVCPEENPQGVVPIQTVADPTTALLLAKAREKMARRKAAVGKEVHAPSSMREANGSPAPPSAFLSTTDVPSAVMLPSSSVAPVASSFTLAALPTPRALSDISSSLPNPSSFTGHSTDSHTHSKEECSTTNDASSFLLSGTSTTIPFSTSAHTSHGGSSEVREDVAVRELSCHSGFTFPPFPASSSFIPKNFIQCDNEDSTRLSPRESDRCNAEKTVRTFAKSYELSWTVSRRILNSSLA